MLKTAKIIFYSLWSASVLFLIVFYFVRPELITVEALSDFISSYENEMLLIYIVLTLVRGIFLIPSTPFVLAGVVLFPDYPIFVVIISMIGIMLTSIALYYFSDILGFSNYLKKKHPDGVEKWKTRLNNPKSTLFVIGWSFFPFVPTDLICYVAGIVKMPFKYMFLGVFIGELILVTFYVYFGSGMIT
jgi:uncharacterized membrane protein YdjX (TVP38/TMEM64 family)